MLVMIFQMIQWSLTKESVIDPKSSQMGPDTNTEMLELLCKY